MSHSINQNITPAGAFEIRSAIHIMMVFMSLYIHCGRNLYLAFSGQLALSSLNIVYPVINVEIAISTMLGTGGNAIISKYLGREKKSVLAKH